jgi:hypothetical protein
MAKTLLVNYNSWEVLTSAWTAAAKPDRRVELVYVWGPDGISLFQSATGTERITLNLSMPDFLSLVERSGEIVDLRGCL